ncbi:hypothetical protein [Kaistia granuli]|uniref:hypothetical protein n=1 Tax=Kaistia granuli TaxID=363259 RepID=UPI00036ADBD4|nr:hypothetical protein [Kaistia granuli]
MVRATSSPVSNPPGPPEDGLDTPLDPAVERVRQRLKRLIIVSSATVLLGFAAVLFAVIYRIGPEGSKPGLAAGTVEMRIEQAIPAGGRVISSALDGPLLALTIDVSGATQIVVIDIASGAVVRRIELGAGS